MPGPGWDASGSWIGGPSAGRPPGARRTLAAPVSLSGRGLFTGSHTRVRIGPAPVGTGLCLSRDRCPPVPVSVAHLASPPAAPASDPRLRRCTALTTPAGDVLTLEHLLGALAGLGITDAYIEVDGPEVPMADGSAWPFVQAIVAAGLLDLDGDGAAPILRLTEPVEVAAGDARIVAFPHAGAGCLCEYALDYGPGAPVAPQRACWDAGAADAPDAFSRHIAPARTFCLEQEARELSAAGLFAHLQPGDVLILGPGGPVGTSLRFPDEPARHKLLDLIGDLVLVGRPLLARVVATRSGHALNHALARRLAAMAPPPR